jgi:hypothetical protein
MAFNFLYGYLSNPECKYTVERDIVTRISKYNKKPRSHFSLSPELVKILFAAGIAVDELGDVPHPHPACATIERHCYSLIEAFTRDQPTTVMFCKDEKYDNFFSADNYTLHNLNLAPKDDHRYSASFTDVPPIRTSHLVLCDTVHHLEPQDVAEFLEQNDDLTDIYVTLVQPWEAVLGTETIRNPVYDCSTSGSFRLFHPDGHTGGSYIEPKSSKKWLEIGTIVSRNVTATVTLIDSFFAHHIMLVTRSSHVVRETRFADLRGHTLVYQPTLTNPMRRVPIPSRLLTALECATLSAGSFTITQMHNRARGIFRAEHYPEDTSILVAAVNYACTRAMPYRSLLACYYPAERVHHLLTRNHFVASLRMLFNPSLLIPWIRLSSLDHREKRTLIHTQTVYTNLTPALGLIWSPQEKTHTLRELGDHLAHVLLADSWHALRAPLYSRVLLNCLLLYNLVYGQWLLGDLYYLGLPSYQAWWPFFAPVLAVFIIAASRLFLFHCECLYNRTHNFFNDTLEASVRPFTSLSLIKKNLDSTTGPKRPVVRPGAAFKETVFTEGTTLGSLTFNRCHSLDNISALNVSLSDAVRSWRDQYDPSHRLYYSLGPTASFKPGFGTRRPGLSASHYVFGLRLCVLPNSDEQPPRVEIAEYLNAGVGSLTTFTSNLSAARDTITAARELGYSTYVDADGFGGKCAAITFRHPDNRQRSCSGQHSYTGEPGGSGEEIHVELPVAATDSSPQGAGPHRGSVGQTDRPSDKKPSVHFEQHPVPESHQKDRTGSSSRRTRAFDESSSAGACVGLSCNSSRSENDCWLVAIADQLGLSYDACVQHLQGFYEDTESLLGAGRPVSLKIISRMLKKAGIHGEVHYQSKRRGHLGATLHSNRSVVYLDLSTSSDHLSSCTCGADPLDVYREASEPVRPRCNAVKTYARFLDRENKTGWLSESRQTDLVKSIVAHSDQYPLKGTPFDTCVILGQFGSGKSSGFRNRFIRWLHSSREGHWIIAYPSTLVRDHDKREIELEYPNLKDFSDCMVTPELAMKSRTDPTVLCITELGKWKPGEAELLIVHLKPELVVCDGDPLQARHSNIGINQTSVETISNWLDVVKKKASSYLDFSYRGPSNYSHMYGTECHGAAAPLPRRVDFPQPGCILVVPDDDTRSALKSHYRTYTYSSSQGLNTKERYVVLINQYSAGCPEETIRAAITRGSSGFDYQIISSASTDAEGVVTYKMPNLPRNSTLTFLAKGDYDGMHSNSLLLRDRQLPEHLKDPMRCLKFTQVGSTSMKTPLLAEDTRPFQQCFEDLSTLPTVLSRLRRLQELCTAYNMVEDPVLLDLIKELPLEDEELFDSLPRHEILQTSTTLSSLEADPDFLIESHFGIAPTKGEREAFYRGIETDQVRGDSNAQQLFINHHSRDPTLQPWGMKKRVRWRKTNAVLDLLKSQSDANVLNCEYMRLMGCNSLPFDEEEFSRRVERSYTNMLDKDKALNSSKAYKCEHSTPEEFTWFMTKHQIPRKINDIFRKAKAPQILTEHVHRVALDLAPVFMYILKKTDDVCLSKGVYLHPGKNDAALAEFNKRWDHSKDSMMDDAEAWDSNVNSPCISHELFLLDFHNIPEHLKQRFRAYKCLMMCILGPVDFMMFSGGPDTLPFNTILCAVLHAVRLSIPPGTPRVQGGDDFAVNGVFPYTSWWLKCGQYAIPQVFKPEIARYPSAFGWKFAPVMHKDPRIILARTIHSISTGKIGNTARDLYADISTIVAAQEFLTEDETIITEECATILEQVRRKQRDPLAGVNYALKLGARRHYNMENLAIVDYTF